MDKEKETTVDVNRGGVTPNAETSTSSKSFPIIVGQSSFKSSSKSCPAIVRSSSNKCLIFLHKFAQELCPTVLSMFTQKWSKSCPRVVQPSRKLIQRLSYYPPKVVQELSRYSFERFSKSCLIPIACKSKSSPMRFYGPPPSRPVPGSLEVQMHITLLLLDAQ